MSTQASTQLQRAKSSRIEAVRTRGFDHPQLPQLLVDVITEAVLAPDFLDRHAGFCLPQKSNDLLFAVFACSHVHHSLG